MKDQQIIQTASILRAIAHPIRIKILKLATQQEQVSMADLLKGIRTDAPSLTRHLTQLREKGLLISTGQGQNIRYEISDPVLIQIVSLLSSK